MVSEAPRVVFCHRNIHVLQKDVESLVRRQFTQSIGPFNYGNMIFKNIFEIHNRSAGAVLQPPKIHVNNLELFFPGV